MAAPITGLIAFKPAGGSPSLVACKNSVLWQWDGSSATQYAAVNIDTSGLCAMVQANDVIYGVDAAGAIFKFTGSVFSLPAITAASGTALTAVKDVLWFQNRLWFASGDQIHWSDVFSPSATSGGVETITEASIRVRQGAGDTIERLMPYRAAGGSGIIIFKRNSAGGGSIYLLDMSASSSDYWELRPLFHDINIISPRAIARVGNDESSDILYLTREGVRSLKITALDRLTGPNLPFSDYVKDYVAGLNYAQADRIHAIVFEDEYLLCVPSGSASWPDYCLAYNLKIPRENLQQGWTTISPFAYSSLATIGFGTARPKLHAGGVNGNLYREFNAAGTSRTYKEISKRVVHSDPNGGPLAEHDKSPRKFLLNFDRDSTGQVDVRLVYQDNTEYLVGTVTLATAGFVIPLVINSSGQFTISGGSIRTEPFDIPYDTSGVALGRYKDVRVDIRSTGNPKILGWRLQSLPHPIRYKEIGDTQSGTVTASNLTPDAVTSATLTMD